MAELAHMVLVLLLLLDDCRILDRIVGLLLLLLVEVSVITVLLVMLGTCVVLIDVRLLVFKFHKTAVRIFVALLILFVPLAATTALPSGSLILLNRGRWGRRQRIYLHGWVLRERVLGIDLVLLDLVTDLRRNIL